MAMVNLQLVDASERAALENAAGYTTALGVQVLLILVGLAQPGQLCPQPLAAAGQKGIVEDQRPNAWQLPHSGLVQLLALADSVVYKVRDAFVNQSKARHQHQGGPLGSATHCVNGESGLAATAAISNTGSTIALGTSMSTQPRPLR